MMERLARAVRNALAYGTTTAPVIAPGNVPQVQTRLSTLELQTMKIVEQRGIASNLPVGTPVLALFQSGDRSAGVICGSVAPGSRPPLAGPQDVALYGYGFTVWIKADGVHIVAPDVWLSGNLHVAGSLDSLGGMSTPGEVIAHVGAGFVSLATHHHLLDSRGDAIPGPVPGT